MKDMFDECQLGNLKLKSRVIRTGIWERETENGGFLTNDVFARYDKIAKSGVGAIISEMFVLDSRDRFYDYSTHTNYKGFIKDYKEITDIDSDKVTYYPDGYKDYIDNKKVSEEIQKTKEIKENVPLKEVKKKPKYNISKLENEISLMEDILEDKRARRTKKSTSTA